MVLQSKASTGVPSGGASYHPWSDDPKNGSLFASMEVGQRLEKRQSTKSIGMRIGEYQLGETIGKGGFGCAT